MQVWVNEDVLRLADPRCERDAVVGLVHTGAADSAGVIDLPVQREAATGYPVIWGQSLKGALCQAAEDAGWGGRVTSVFGSEVGDNRDDGGTSPGTLAVGDAQLVAMPVPTLRHTFAWLTSEVALCAELTAGR